MSLGVKEARTQPTPFLGEKGEGGKGATMQAHDRV